MALNVAKCKHMSFIRSCSRILLTFSMGSVSLLETVSDYKYLIVYFSFNLIWKRQVEHLSFSASRILKRNFSDATLKDKELYI